MKRWLIIPSIVLAIALVGGAGYLGFRSTQAESEATPPPPQTVSVTRGDVQQTVSAPGHLVTTRQVDLAMEASGKLEEVTVRPGDSVQQGDVLAKLETGPLEQALAQADVNLRLAQLDLSKAREGPSEVEIAAAEAAVRDAQVKLQIAWQRYEARLNSDVDHRVRAAKVTYDWYVGYYQQKKAEFEAGKISQTEHDYAMNEMLKAEGRLNEALAESEIEDVTYANQVDQAHSTLYQAQETLELLRSEPLTETLIRAEVEVDEALLAREQARANLEAAILCAPFDGAVVAVNAAPGDQVTAGMNLITLLDPAAVEAKVTVVEEDLPLIEAGQTVDLFFDARPDATVQGRVARIVPQRESGSDRPLYPIYIALDEMPDGLFPGMTVDASIIISSRSDVLQLPRALVRARSDSTAEVEVWTGDHIETRTVHVGLRGDVYVEILDGLREREQVVGQ
jgi:HlyD family secretion protein